MSAPLCVIGDFAWDVLIRTNSTLLTGGDTFGEVMLTPGGSAANVAVWAARCGLHTEFIGKIGRDRLVQLAQEDLAKEKVVTHLVETDEHLTGCVAVFVDRPASVRWCRAAPTSTSASEVPRETVRQSRHLHMTAWSFFVDPPRSASRCSSTRPRARSNLVVRSRVVQMIEEMESTVSSPSRRISATCSAAIKRVRC